MQEIVTDVQPMELQPVIAHLTLSKARQHAMWVKKIDIGLFLVTEEERACMVSPTRKVPMDECTCAQLRVIGLCGLNSL